MSFSFTYQQQQYTLSIYPYCDRACDFEVFRQSDIALSAFHMAKSGKDHEYN